ncbi:hypothetical protein [Adhaeribacter radiodurans]|uniref:Prolyl-tRNA synthetase n=1 Tax=Adhaeribacter radiodurans TaxID=2745197 RepID=A0A7L7L1V3_9BACT|nr:hypothetical protein [Adhaeribacter radiodurans]QMU26771.1 hypothetical protein HUW48_01400 [Adhaeribacter radiodurans]
MKYAKKISLVPLVALLLAGCSGPAAITSSTETDDLYYASTDKTVYASKQTVTTSENIASNNSDANADEVANPEYSGTTKNNSNSDSYSDYDYYSDDYTYASRIRRFNSPYRGMSYYDFAYTDPYWYGSSFYAYNPFYDPFSYSPGFYRPGFYTGLSLNLGWGNSFYSPFYGYNNFYNPYGFGGGLFSGYRNGYSNGFYNGFYNGYYANGGNYDRYPNYRSRNYGPRSERSVVPTDRNNGGRIVPNTGGNRVIDNPGGRPARIVSGGGAISPNTNTGGVRTPDANVTPNRSVRGARVVSPTDAGMVVSPNNGQPARVNTSPNNTDLGYRPSTRPVRRFEGTISNNNGAPTPPSFPAEVQRQNNNRPQRVIESQPRTFETPRYEAPRREQRTYEISSPQRNDSWSQPSRSSSFPSNNGGNSGGSSGGGRPRRN